MTTATTSSASSRACAGATMAEPPIVVGGPPHEHVNPSYMSPNVNASDYRWNTVVLSSCDHLYVRRHSLGFLFPLHDHFPQWVRLRPWHVVANVKVLGLLLSRFTGGRDG